MKSFVLNTIKALNSPIPSDKILWVECRPNAVMRSILGHILAAKTETDEVIPDEKMRSFIFDYSKPIPKDFHVLYWFYPFSSIRITRDFVIPVLQNKRGGIEVAFCNLIKFFPLAFLVSDTPSYSNLPNLDQYRDLPVQTKSKIPIFIARIRDEGWPEIPSDSGNPFIAGGRSFFQDSISAIPRKLIHD